MRFLLGLFFLIAANFAIGETINITCVSRHAGTESLSNFTIVSAGPNSKGKVYANDKDLDSLHKDSRQNVADVVITPSTISWKIFYYEEPGTLRGSPYPAGISEVERIINRTSGHSVQTIKMRGGIASAMGAEGTSVIEAECGPRKANKF